MKAARRLGWLALLLGGCAGGGSHPRAASVTVNLRPFHDQWSLARPRLRDVADTPYASGFGGVWPGQSASVTLRYDPAPDRPCLTGALRGSGLKPNFCYQLKLMGKPGTAGGGLWGAAADNATNDALISRARWWSYRTETALFNTSSAADAFASDEYRDGWLAGYVYCGWVLTDARGNFARTDRDVADAAGWVPLTTDRCFHITGKTGQEGSIPVDTTPVTVTLARPASAAYDHDWGPASLSLWYQREPDNPLDFALPAGTHDVVLMLTEESFHNPLATPDGGFWQSVWVSDWPTGPTAWVDGPGAAVRFNTR